MSGCHWGLVWSLRSVKPDQPLSSPSGPVLQEVCLQPLSEGIAVASVQPRLTGVAQDDPLNFFWRYYPKDP